MPEYLSLLREASVASIYILFILTIILLLIKGRIKIRELATLFYIWLPIAVITQFLMTYFRLSFGKSNLPIMNIYLMIEFTLIVLILIKFREVTKGVKTDYKLWFSIIAGGIIIHFIDDFNTIHNAAILYIAIIYFQLTINSTDYTQIDKLLNDPYTLLNITIFVKAFGYSYFLIYQSDYTFPLSIYSGVNLLVQILFGITLIQYYKQQS